MFIDISILPSVNASLNGTSAVLLLTGYTFIKKKAVLAHKITMLCACLTSTLFLISYLYYHAHHGITHFQGRGTLRVTYFAILVSHTILAVLIVPLIIITLFLALKSNFLRHKTIARITLPLWLYVSVTGVLVYWMLYNHL